MTRAWLIVWTACAAAQAQSPVKLVVQITVDQLRGDMPLRFADRFEEGGFRRLMTRGAHFTDAHYRHSTTFTACGHATLFTGANPAEHGIVGNEWADPASGRRVTSVQDERFPVLDVPAQGNKGASPMQLIGGTIGDELIAASGGKSRVFSVSLKDRGAVLPGGRLGKAAWYVDGRFVTSRYYDEQPPAWLEEWNERKYADRYRGKEWTLLRPRGGYLRAEQDDDPAERPFKHMGRVFPHPLEGKSEADFYEALAYSPFGDEMTEALVEHLVRKQRLGQGPAVDFLAVSFTCTDYVGHAFGPDSLEAEDNLYRLDRTLARLLDFLDQQVGLSKTLVVLSADHGVDSAPELRHRATCAGMKPDERWAARTPGEALLQLRLQQGQPPTLCCAAGRHVPDQYIAQANATMRARFGVDRDLVTQFANPSFYLDTSAMRELKLEQAAVERALADWLASVPGVALAATRADLLAGRLPDTPVARMLQRSFHPARSGHVLVVQSPHWLLYPDPFRFAAMHGSPHAYDTHVPILFMGPGIAPARVVRRVGPEDIAPTLAQYLGIPSPPLATGLPMPEALPR
jgi:predicted AlkP superfamily pyrophosphatase or phosphodiesterase